MRRFAAIPAHPQKQYTRRWRLYHFCGFYYPIREVIPIAIYHWNIGIVSRGKGKSAVAAAAYRSGEKLTNEWDGMTHDYTRKGGVVHTEIMLPPHAPPSFSDRSTLWNSVELYEKAGNAQLAREIDAALPIELSREEQIRLVREYCSSQFVSRGMCVDFAIHDTDSGNPHCHIMLTMRPLDERGTWAAKSKKEYDLDENGERMLLHSLECSDDAGIATVKKDISMLEAALKKLAQHEEKYTDELNDALRQYADLKEQAAEFDPEELQDARCALRPAMERSAVDCVQSAYGNKYDPLMMYDSKRDVANLLREEAKARSIHERLRQEQQTQQRRLKIKLHER